MNKNERGLTPQIDRKLPQIIDSDRGILPFTIDDTCGETTEYIDFEELPAFQDSQNAGVVNSKVVTLGISMLLVLAFAVLLAYLLSLIIDLLFKSILICVAIYVAIAATWTFMQVRTRQTIPTEQRDVYIENNVSARDMGGRITIINNIK